MATSVPYIVIDTNVLISAGILPSSRTAKVLQLALEHFVVAQNDETWLELETRIVRTKFDQYFPDDARADYLIRLAQSMEWFESKAQTVVSRDSDDDKFISLALDAGAKLIVSGDPDLKEIKKYQGIDIYSPSEFFAKYDIAAK